MNRKNITFNLDDIVKKDVRVADFNVLKEMYNNPERQSWELFFKPKELENVLISSFSITSTEIRDFIENTFGIEMNITQTSSNHNRLNEMIREVAVTKKGKRTKLNYYQYRDLILSERFYRFILKNYDERRVRDIEKLYSETMYLHINKFNKSSLYLEQKKKDIVYYANALSLIHGFDEILKKYYSMFIDLWHNQGIYYGDIYASNETKQILDIISYRFRQKSEFVYKFSSREDVYSTNKNQIIEFFLQDIDRWANEEIK